MNAHHIAPKATGQALRCRLPAAAQPCADLCGPSFTIYVLVRTDIALARQVVQALHGAAECGRRFYAEGHGVARLVLLSVPSREALLAAQQRLQRKGIPVEIFVEPDDGMGESALATAPLPEASRKHLMGFPLWRPPVATPSAAQTAGLQ